MFLQKCVENLSIDAGNSGGLRNIIAISGEQLGDISRLEFSETLRFGRLERL